MEVSIAGKRLYGMYDTGSNCTIVSRKVAAALGVRVIPYTREFRQATGQMSTFRGKLAETSVQLHDRLKLVVDGIRVMDTFDERIQVILGTDLFNVDGVTVMERGTVVRHGRKVVQMELTG